MGTGWILVLDVWVLTVGAPQPLWGYAQLCQQMRRTAGSVSVAQKTCQVRPCNPSFKCRLAPRGAGRPSYPVHHPHPQDCPVDAAKRLFDVNYFGCVAMVRALAPAMTERRSGTIINVG